MTNDLFSKVLSSPRRRTRLGVVGVRSQTQYPALAIIRAVEKISIPFSAK